MTCRPVPRRAADEGGFTLVELLVVIVILGALSAVVVASVSGISNRGEDSACEAELATLSRAVEVYRTSNLGPVTDALLVGAGLLRAEPTLYMVRAAEDIAPRPGAGCEPTPTEAAAPRVPGAVDWAVLRGSAVITDGLIDLRKVPGGAATVVLRQPGASADHSISTTATLYDGAGYGLWVRGTFDDKGAAQAGYSVQVDQTFGKFVVRQWSAGAECRVPLATASWPAGSSPLGEHVVSATVSGDTLTMSFDGATALTIPSLAAAAAGTPCQFPAATGTNMGIRTWNGAQATFSGTTVL